MIRRRVQREAGKQRVSISVPAPDKRAGRVLTPEPLARALCHWAIRAADDVVLDLGVGEGAFALAAFDRLRALGAADLRAASLIYGAEQDAAVFACAQAMARMRLGMTLPNVVCADFYDSDLPSADAVVGNPPYIRRHYQNDHALLCAALTAGKNLGLTDAYCHFLLRGCSALRAGGRLAVIVSASWLDMQYGRALKRVLLEDFRLRLLLAFDRRVFSNALIKPVVILAEKLASKGTVSFGRLTQGESLDGLGGILEKLTAEDQVNSAAIAQVAQSDLSASLLWSAFLKAPDVYADLLREAPLTPLMHMAESRIGLQTFAKRFYIMTGAEGNTWGIEKEYLLPLVFSPRETRGPVIDDLKKVPHMVFACDKSEEALHGTGAWRYITSGMRATVRVRGKQQTVAGFHTAPRLVRARRRPWYNLLTAIERRERYPILLPRRFFEFYLVIHNLAGAIANEDFMELRPLSGDTGVAPLLAFLNSSIGEYVVRTHSFQYGGGVYNLNPGEVRNIPVIDLSEIFPPDRARLAQAWDAFVASFQTTYGRSNLDGAVSKVLGISPELQTRIGDALALFLQLARTANQPYQTVGTDCATFQ